MATVTINDLPDATRERLEGRARRNRRSLSEEIVALLERALAPPSPTEAVPDRFERHFGAVDLGRPTDPDNEQIDADLGRAYSASS